MPADDEDISEFERLPAFDAARFGVLSELSEEGDDDILKEIVRQFLDDLGPLLEAIEQGFLAKDFARLADAAHTLKGGAAQFGLLQVEEAARRLEKGAKAGEEDEAGRWRELLKRALPAGIEPLERMVREG